MSSSSSRPSMPEERNSGSSTTSNTTTTAPTVDTPGSIDTIGSGSAGSSGGITTRGLNNSSPSEDDNNSTTYFHSAASTLAGGDGSGSGSGGTPEEEGEGEGGEAARENENNNNSQRHASSDPSVPSPSSNHPSRTDDDGVTRMDFANQPVSETLPKGIESDHSLQGEREAVEASGHQPSRSYSSHSQTSSASASSSAAHRFSFAAQSPSSTNPASSAADLSQQSQQQNVHQTSIRSPGGRRPSNSFIIDGANILHSEPVPPVPSTSTSTSDAVGTSQQRERQQSQSSTTSSWAHENPQSQGSTSKSNPHHQSGPQQQQQLQPSTSQQPSRSHRRSSQQQQQQQPPQQQQREPKDRNTTSRVSLSQIDAAKQDYFSRHPDPDSSLRNAYHAGTIASSSTNRRRGRPGSAGSNYPSDASQSQGKERDKTSLSASEDEENPTTTSSSSAAARRSNADRGGGGDGAETTGSNDFTYGGGLFSPTLSTGTLSSGVSVGPSMGGYERIFPIRSVVAGQRPPPQPPASSSTSIAQSLTSNKTPYPPVPIRGYSMSGPSARSTSSATTALDQTQQMRRTNAKNAAEAASHHETDTVNEELEVGTDYSRRSPIPDDVSDFSFTSSGGRGTGDGERRQKRASTGTRMATDASSGGKHKVDEGVGEGELSPPMPHPPTDRPLQRGDPASLYGSATSYDAPSKPFYYRNDSLMSEITGTSSDPTGQTSSYPTTSRHSDDSDPTARKENTSTAPSTVSPTPFTPSSLRPGMQSLASQGQISYDNGGLGEAAAYIDHNDPNHLARVAYEKGEAEEGPSVDTGGLGSLGIEQDGVFLTHRFEHQETGDGHMIVTGRKGVLLKCEDEPIHIPGAVQDYGVLIALEEDDNGHFVVVQVSENSGSRLGLPPKVLFSLNCFTEALEEDQAEAFLDAMETLDENSEDSAAAAAAGEVEPMSALANMNTFQLSGQGIPGSGMDGEDSRLEWTCWCALHRPEPQNRPKLIIVELEYENDLMNPVMRERTQDEIDEDRAKEQGLSLFSEEKNLSPEEEALRREQELRDHQNTGRDAAGLPRTARGHESVSPSGDKGSEGEFPGVGRGSGEVPDASSPEASLPGQVGEGGENTEKEAPSESEASTTKPSMPSPEGLGEAATQAEIDASTISRIKPIRMLRRMRKSKGGGDIMKLFSLLGQVNDELNKAQDLQTSLEIAAAVVSEVTGFHRVMIYQFDDSWNGQVVAELVDYKQTRDLYRGLHFPASDIPAQARELYKINKVRLLYDRDQPTARLVCRSKAELEHPLNLTHAQLRAMSPIHIRYLANMGVRASMSISIIAFGQLWGLISCHTYGRYGQRVTFPGRQLCRIIGDSVSRNIERLSYAQRLQSRKLINTIPTNSNPGGYIIAKAEDLLALFDADFGVLSIGDEAKILGSLENSQEVLAILEYLRLKRSENVQASTNILADFPDLDYPAGFQQVAGMLLVPLSSSGQDFIAFFRRGQLEHVHWAGNPYEKVMQANQGKKRSLEPRKSFKIWSETVVGKSRGWTDENMETASVLRLVYGKFIEVWRQREAAVTSSRLTSLLLSNASHEVRTPLNHIINYLEMALEGPLDDDTRDSLVRSHSASRALVHVINDLLDLTRTEQNQDMFLQDPLDLSDTIDEAVAIHRLEAQRRGVAFEIVENPSGTPQTLLGDRGKIRQIVANVTANAVKHTKEGKVTVEWGELTKDSDDPAEVSQDTIKIGISISDTGAGIPEDQLEEMFRTFEQVETADSSKSALNAPTGSLGLGLAVVARIVSQLGGQLRVESKVGHGSKFTFVLHFRLPGPDNAPASSASVSGSVKSRDSVDKIISEGSGGKSLQNTRSVGSLSGSLQSNNLSNNSKKSEIDSLVEAIGSTNLGPRSPRGREQELSIRSRAPKAGQVEIEASGTPLRSVRIDEGDVDVPSVPSHERPAMRRQRTGGPVNTSYGKAGAVSSSTQDKRRTGQQESISSEATGSSVAPEIQPLRIMIVEDDAINRAILLKKLTKDLHHKVTSTVHGEEAVRLFEKDREFDVILMDLQMPICDGYTATKRIREIEERVPHSPNPSDWSENSSVVHPALGSQVPIFAVSASLHEHQKNQLLECGFSGFMLKPINFARLQDLMRGVTDTAAWEANQYIPGRWEKGGWLIEPPSTS